MSNAPPRRPHHAPPPTKYGATSPAQAKISALPAQPAAPHAPPPTRYQPALSAQAKHGATPPGPIVHRPPTTKFSAPGRAVQPMFKFKIEDDEISRVNITGRTSTVVRGSQGQHTSANLMHTHFIENALVGNDLETANTNLQSMLGQFQTYPTYQDTSQNIKNQFQLPFQNPQDFDELGQNAYRVLELRNNMSGAAFPSVKSKSPKSRSKHSGVNEGILDAVETMEKKYRSEKPLSKQEAAYTSDQIMYTLWDGWHFNPAKAMDSEVVAKSIVTHAMECVGTYRDVCEQNNIMDSDLVLYLFNSGKYIQRMSFASHSKLYTDKNFIQQVKQEITRISNINF